MRLLVPTSARSCIVSAVLAVGVWGCQGPEAFFRAYDAGITARGTGGSPDGIGGAPGTGGRIAAAGSGGAIGGGSGGKIAGTGDISGTGGAPIGAGGAPSGAGGLTGGTGGAIGGTGGDQGDRRRAGRPLHRLPGGADRCKVASSTQELRFSIQLVNKTTLPINYADISVRYWYKIYLPNEALTFSMDYARSLTAAQVLGTFGTAGANQYVQVAFAPSAGALASGASSGEIQLRVNAHDPGWNASQADDYTFMGCPTTATFTAWSQITGYVGGALAWGTEPPP